MKQNNEVEIRSKFFESEEKYRTIVENSPNLIAIIQNNALKYANQTLCKRLGYSYEEVTSPSFDSIRKLVAPRFQELARSSLQKRLRGESVALYEVSLSTRDGLEIPVIVKGEKILYMGKPADLIILIDITERKRVEQALKESEERLHMAAEIASDWISEWDIQTGRLEWFGDAYKKLGYAPDEFPRTIEAWESIIHLDDRDNAMTSIREHVKLREPYYVEYRVRRKDGTYLHVTDRGRILVDEKGNQKWITVNTDVTERRLAEQVVQRRLEFEETVSKISSYFIGASDIDRAINTSLADMGRLSRASRAYVFLFRENGTIMDNTHEWCAEGASPQINNLQNLFTDRFPWWMTKLREEEIIQIEDASKMPVEARTEQRILLEDQDIKSLLVLPLYVGQKLGGFIGFDNVIGTGRWSDDDLALLKVSSKIIGDALDHKRMEDAIRNHTELLEKKVRERTEEIERLNATVTERLIQKINQISHISEIREMLRKSAGAESSLETILGGVMEDLDLDRAAVLLTDRGHRAVDVRAFKSKTNIDISRTYMLDRPFAEYECMDEKDCTSRIVGEQQSILRAKSVHCAPITFGNEVTGFLVAGSAREEKLDESDLSVLKLYSGLVSTVFETASLTIAPTKETVTTRKSMYKIDPGSNIIVEDHIDLAYEIFLDRIMSGMEGLLITRVFPNKVRKKYGMEKTPIIWLNDEKVEGQLTISNLQDLSIAISNYVGKAEKPIILIDGIEYLVSNQGFDSVHRFLQSKRTQIESTGSILIVPFFKDALDAKQSRLIEREFDLFGQKQIAP